MSHYRVFIRCNTKFRHLRGSRYLKRSLQNDVVQTRVSRSGYFPALQQIMPAKPAYTHLIPELLQHLETSRHEWVDRRYLEEALGISKTVAWRLLRRLGAREGPGNTLVLGRAEAIERVKRLEAEGGAVHHEVRRRSKLEQYLEGMRSYVAAQRTTVAADDRAIGLRNTRFDNLPANVALTPRSLQIEFGNTEEFLRAFGAVVFALNNDYEAIRNFIDHAAVRS